MTRKKIEIQKVEKIWLSTAEAAEYLGVSKTFLADLRKNGTLPHSRIGNTAFFKKTDIDWMLEQNKVY